MCDKPGPLLGSDPSLAATSCGSHDCRSFVPLFFTTSLQPVDVCRRWLVPSQLSERPTTAFWSGSGSGLSLDRCSSSILFCLAAVSGVIVLFYPDPVWSKLQLVSVHRGAHGGLEDRRCSDPVALKPAQIITPPPPCWQFRRSLCAVFAFHQA